MDRSELSPRLGLLCVYAFEVMEVLGGGCKQPGRGPQPHKRFNFLLMRPNTCDLLSLDLVK